MKNFIFHVYLTIWLFSSGLAFCQTWFGFFSQEMSGNPVGQETESECSFSFDLIYLFVSRHEVHTINTHTLLNAFTYYSLMPYNK